MEGKLRRLFDYQRFAGNARMAKLIEETENRCDGALSDDELSLVSAAGDVNLKPEDAGNDA